MSEQVMVVAREDLAQWIGDRQFAFIREDTDAILAVINERHFFIERPVAEVSPQYKQIIPYVLIRHGDEYYLLTRTAKQTESRLHHKRSLGIGGHINPDTPTLLGGLRKELEEEVHVDGERSLTFAGILNDDTTEVGQVHLGAVFILESASRDVHVRETEKMTGAWAGRESLAEHRDAMETWSQIVYDELLL